MQQASHDAFAAQTSAAATDSVHMLHRGTRDGLDRKGVSAEFCAVDQFNEQITGGERNVVGARGGQAGECVSDGAAASGAVAGDAVVDDRRTGRRETRWRVAARVERRDEHTPRPQQFARRLVAHDRAIDRGGRVSRKRAGVVAGAKGLREKGGECEQFAGRRSLTHRNRANAEREGSAQHTGQQRVVGGQAAVDGDALEDQQPVADAAEQCTVARARRELAQSITHQRLHDELGVDLTGVVGRAERLHRDHAIDQQRQGPQHVAGRTAVGHRTLHAAVGRARAWSTASVAKRTHAREVTKQSGRWR